MPSASVSPETLAFGGCVRELRRQRGWTTAELGERAGHMAGRQVSALERGEHAPTLLTMQRIADALAVPLHLLIVEYEQRLTASRRD